MKRQLEQKRLTAEWGDGLSMDAMEKDRLTEALSKEFTGPILFYYVWWVLHHAMERGIGTLWFLARDGYLLREIALRFCEQFHLPIDCRYLYVSRASLRMPSYHFIGDEAWELLTYNGYYVTPRFLLQRAELTPEQRAAVYESCGVKVPDENCLLNHAEVDAWRTALKISPVYHKFVREKSKAAYGDAIGYLRQAGLFDQNHVALVDTGWTGSMQRSLRQLLQFDGYDGTFTGFYYGMYVPPRSPEDGAYLTWYFNRESSPRDKIPFCNNLFECMLPAPHGMTAGYQSAGGGYAPATLAAPEGEELAHIQSRVSAVLGYTRDRLEQTDFEAFCPEAALRDTRKLISRYMAHPSREEAVYFGRALFCDDITEAYRLSLADETQVQALKGYSIPTRVWRRLLSQKATEAQLFWPYGTIAFLPKWKQWWYRWNVYVWEWLRYELH